MRSSFTLLVLAFVCPPSSVSADEPPTYLDRWLYCQRNLQVEKNADDLVALIDRAAKADYTGIVLADYEWLTANRIASTTGRSQPLPLLC